LSVPATVVVAITADAASTKAVDAIEVESLFGDWGFEVGAEKVYFRLLPPPGQWMQ
jgi:predicted dinucleotide-utilizing enzyme